MSHFNAGDTVIIVDDNRARMEVGIYTIESVGRKFFHVRDSYGRASFSLINGAENVKPGREPEMRFAYTPQDWKIESRYRQLISDLNDAGCTIRNPRKYPTGRLQIVLDALTEP